MQPLKAYPNILTTYIDDCSFLWQARSSAAHQNTLTLSDSIERDQRINLLLRGLTMAAEPAWELAREAFDDFQGPGELFVCAMLAFMSDDIDKIKWLDETVDSDSALIPAWCSTLAWLPKDRWQYWRDEFFASKKLQHKYVALTVCRLRGEVSAQSLTTLFQRADCLDHPGMLQALLRCSGELKLHALLAHVQHALGSQDEEVQFWASYASVLLGDRQQVEGLKPFVFCRDEDSDLVCLLQEKAIQIAFRTLPNQEAKAWISEMIRQKITMRMIILAVATLGDPHAMPWLIEQMAAPLHARQAAAAFSLILGCDIEANALSQSDPEDENGELEILAPDDSGLPWPEAKKIALFWQQYGQNFQAGQRYLFGKIINPDNVSLLAEHLQVKNTEGAESKLKQYQLKAIAFELAVQTRKPLINLDTHWLSTSG